MVSTIDDAPWSRRVVRDEANEWEDEFVYEGDAYGLTMIALRTVNGNVRVTGSDSDRLRIVVTRKVRATDAERGRDYKERLRPELNRDGASLVVEWRSPNESWNHIIRDASLVYDAVVPTHLQVEATSVNGNVIVRDAGTRVALATVNGNATLDSRVDLVDGVAAKSVNGNIGVTVGNVSPDARFETVNGNIALTAARGLAAELTANTVNGNLDIRVPADSRFDLKANVGAHGAIRTDWGSPQSEKRLGSAYNVAVNGGGNTIKLNTLNGAIHVRSVGDE